MHSIGIFTAGSSLQNIMENLDSDMREICNITYFPYSSLEHLCYLYKQNYDRFDAFLFSGYYPYRGIRQAFGTIKQPHTYFVPSEADYYKLVARLAINNPGLDFKRVYFEKPEMSIDFKSIFGKEGLPVLDDPPIDWEHLTDWYPPLKEYWSRLWATGKYDLIVTRFGNFHNFFAEKQIRHEFIVPGRESMLATFRSLMLQLKVNDVHNFDTCIGLVKTLNECSKCQWEKIRTALIEYNEKQGHPFLIYERENRYELTTNLSILREQTNNFKSCSLIAYLYEKLGFSIYIGWGVSINIIDAHRNARRAEKEAYLYGTPATFILTSDNRIIGPLTPTNKLENKDKLPSTLALLGKRLAISPNYLDILSTIIKRKNDNVIDPEEFAGALGLSSRSAYRILQKLVNAGRASIIESKLAKQRGRPKRMFKVTL